MLDTAKGKIFLASKRSHIETEIFRSFNSFTNNSIFGSMHYLKDETLAGGKTTKIDVEKDMCIVLLPVIGTIYSRRKLLSAGEAGVFYLVAGDSLEINNPFTDDMVNYILICFTNELHHNHSRDYSFNIDQHKNSLKEICREKNFNICIGKFDGRNEVLYNLYSENNGVFAFVVQGAFEVQYRLMETKDGLALWNTSQIDLEALSNEAIILLIELSL